MHENVLYFEHYFQNSEYQHFDIWHHTLTPEVINSTRWRIL